MTTAAYFDVDGTLVDTTLLHPTVMVLANQATPWQSAMKLGKAVLSAPLLMAAELRDRRLFNEMLFAHYKGVTEDRMRALADDVFKTMIKPRIFKGTMDLIRKSQDAGQRVVLISGSLDYQIRTLAEHLQVDDWIANRLEMKDGKATGKLLRPIVAGPDKVQLMVEDARKHNHDLAECHAYSDSFSDVPMLSVVGHPFCINPDHKLRRLADAYQWPILDISLPPRGELGSR